MWLDDGFHLHGWFGFPGLVLRSSCPPVEALALFLQPLLVLFALHRGRDSPGGIGRAVGKELELGRVHGAQRLLYGNEGGAGGVDVIVDA